MASKKKPEDWVGLVVQRGEHAKGVYSNLFKRFTRWYDLYRGHYPGKQLQTRNFLHIPIALSIIMSDVARKVQTCFGAWPILQFMGYPPESEQQAKRVEVLVSAQMKDAGMYAKAVDFFTCADLFGTAIFRTGWTQNIQKTKRRSYNRLTDEEEVTTTDLTLFDGPDAAVLDPQDFWPQGGAKRWATATYAIERYTLDIDVVKARVASGEFRKDTLSQLGGDAPATVGSDLIERYGRYRSWFDESAKETEPLSTKVEVWEYNGEVPDEFREGGFETWRVIVLNRNTLALAEPYPFWHGDIHKQYLMYSPMPDPGYMHGTGKMEVIEKMQAAVDKLGSIKLDLLELFAAPPFLYNNSGAGLDTQNFVTRPGRGIPVDGPVDDSQIRPIQFDLRGVSGLYTEMSQLNGWMQQGTGIAEDTVQGMPGSSRATAREVLIRQEAVLTRLMLEARLAEEGVIEPLGNTMMDLNRQYLKVPKIYQILGSLMTTNPFTGMSEPMQQTIITLDDINVPYSARAVGATQMMGKSVRQQNAIALLQATSGHPMGMQIVNWNTFFRTMFDIFDFHDPNLLQQTVPAINQYVNQMGQQPPTMEDMLSGQGGMDVLPQMEPDLMGRQDMAPMSPLSPMEGM